MKKRTTLGVLSVVSLICGGVAVGCGSVAEPKTEPDAGLLSDAQAVDAAITPVEDAGSDASGGSMGCLRSASLGPFTPILAEGVPLQVRYFRTSRDGKRAYYVLPTSPMVVRTANIMDGELTNPQVALEVPLSIDGGIAVSPSGLNLYITFRGTTIVSYTRTTLSDVFGGAGTASAFTPPVPSTGDLIWYPYVASPSATGPDTLLFGLFQMTDAGIHQWDIVRGTIAGDVVMGSLEASAKPNPSYVFAPVQSDPLHLMFAQWGTVASDGYPRIFQTKRSAATDPWEQPYPLSIDGFTPVNPEVAIPLDETSDGCTVFFGKAPGLTNIVYTVYRSERPQ